MQTNLDKPIRSFFDKITIRHILIVAILLLAVLTRLINLGDRVMSHDEVNHVVPSFDFYSGRGYQQDPITHGPLQFHLIALSYFLFGDNDFTSRLPHAIFSIATVAFVLIKYRRYLGKYGSLAAGLFFAISPFMMFYGRYTRNEAICAFLSVVTIYSVLRYLEEGHAKHLFWMVAALALNFTAKETAYIFTAQLLVFLFILAIKDLVRIKWPDDKIRRETLLYNLAVVVVIAAALGISIFLMRRTNLAVLNETISIPILENQTSGNLISRLVMFYPLLQSVLPVMLILFASLVFLLVVKEKLHWQELAASRALSLTILTGTLVLPLLAAFPVSLAGISPIAYEESFSLLADYIYLTFFIGLAIAIGFIWQPKDWWKYASVFFGIYLVFFTTFFTNSVGILTGMIGSLGHWLSQQDVARGGQPIYYFALIQIPVYEFLGAIGTILAFILGLRRKSFWSSYPKADDSQESSVFLPVPAIFIFWSITSLVAYSFAGEKMPWLTVHIAFSMLLCAGWVVQKLFESKAKQDFSKAQKAKYFLLAIVFVFLVILLFVQLLGTHAPFQSKTQQHLKDTIHFFFLFILTILVGYFLFRQENRVNFHRLGVNVCLGLFLIMSIITMRSAYRASFINYDYPYEYLVYAHAADGPKIVLNQIEEISERMTGGLDIKVAYDNHGLYPYWWYLRNYPNKIVYLENPTRSLEEAELIIAGPDKYDQIDAIVRDNYYVYEYMRLWWPMQDYFSLNWERVSNALSNSQMRQAIFNIWLNRDYSLYAQVNNNSFLTLDNWLPSEKMRFYVRKDIAAQMWQLNTEASLQQVVEVDPYAQKTVAKQADYFIGISGSNPGELNTPHGIDVAPDGSIYVADSGNNHIQRFSADGTLLDSFGTYASVLEGDAPGGTMSEPWDVAVASDGSIFVADTFNHRIQKFTADGNFVKMWGIFAQGDDPQSFWGPRGIAIDPKGNVLVTDTGNKRVLVFDQELNFITQFGGAGFEAGQFDEPVGIAISQSGQVVIADTWNRRVQIFEPDESGLNYNQVGVFDVDAWYGTGIENKPYLAISPNNTILVSDPEGNRILEFSMSGDFITGWEDLSPSGEFYSQPYGLDFDDQGNLWVSDGASSLLLRFKYLAGG
jgi:predicted membrane-bound mannosyltransferase/DNA-binding beta-propeller fold protein YncE